MNRIQYAFEMMNRRHFLPKGVRRFANEDKPLPIGYGQTNSQPSTVRQMLEWLNPQTGNRILDVGSGSGWTTALLSYLVGSKGHVYAVEIVPKLVDMGRQNCEALDIKNVEFFQAGNEIGLPDYAPFDRMLVSAGANKLPSELVKQLKPDGKMVIPVGYDILEITKRSNKELRVKPHEGFLFVPLR